MEKEKMTNAKGVERTENDEKRELRTFKVPAGWNELTPSLYKYFLMVMAIDGDLNAAKVRLVLRANGVAVLGRDRNGDWIVSRNDGTHRGTLSDYAMAFLISDNLRWMDDLRPTLHLAKCGGRDGREKLLHGTSFVDYLNMEVCYQGYLRSQDERPLARLTGLLYPESGKVSPYRKAVRKGLEIMHSLKGRKEEEVGESLKPVAGDTKFHSYEMLNAFLWYGYIKSVLGAEFPDLFTREGVAGQETDMLQVTNAEIRALTGGDVTKEKKVFDTDCWRCLTQLDALAGEARRERQRMEEYKRNKNIK